MEVKDYYKILEIPPSATLKEIKAAYRRLAHQYHPDKTNNNPYAAAQFEIIKEAYEILCNPSKKEYFLQQRWYEHSKGRKGKETAVTPVSVLQQLLELNRYVSKLDVYRMDKEGLYQYLSHILSNETIEKLNGFNEPDINDSIIDIVLKNSHSLPLLYAKPLTERLKKLKSGTDSEKSIEQFLRHSRQSAAWNKYRVFLILIVVLLLCILIYSISNN